MKLLIAYQTFLGSTNKYAEWLKEKTGGEMMRLGEAKPEALEQFDEIVVMSGTYAAQMPMVKFLTANWPILQNKKVVAIAVGAAHADDEQSKKSYELIPPEIRSKISYHKLPGRLFGINKDKIRPENLEEILKEIG